MRKSIALLLAVATLVPALAACVKTDEPEKESGGETETVEAYLDAVPEDLKFDGEDIVILSRGSQHYTRDEIAVPELNSEPVNDAMFNRNITVGDRLNVNIVSKPIEDADPFKTVEEIERLVKGGGDDYDMFAGACYATLPSALRGTFYDLSNLEYLDLSQSYWMQDYNNTISYGDSQYTATGTIVAGKKNTVSSQCANLGKSVDKCISRMQKKLEKLADS